MVSVPSVKLLPQWAFVKEAKYKGEATFNQTKVDIWTYNVCTALWQMHVEHYNNYLSGFENKGNLEKKMVLSEYVYRI